MSTHSSSSLEGIILIIPGYKCFPSHGIRPLRMRGRRQRFTGLYGDIGWAIPWPPKSQYLIQRSMNNHPLVCGTFSSRAGCSLGRALIKWSTTVCYIMGHVQRCTTNPYRRLFLHRFKGVAPFIAPHCDKNGKRLVQGIAAWHEDKLPFHS